ncbi:MAG: aspartate--ammonia ligase [Muribaculaceae bacterium]|nr:aspartate--ammonia ligase [Muribaculaceae bacterium]MDE6832575.1 aspartate--ammonia ligase [Muribaculaceae bacterium]
MSLILPDNYKVRLLPETTEVAIKLIKETFERELTKVLNLRRVTAPLFVREDSGLNDNLNGVEPPVTFEAASIPGARIEVVHSLAKWKRMKLSEYEMAPGYGIYTDMNAIRTAEELDNLHSLYVDQWDWEKAIEKKDRTTAYLRQTVTDIYNAILTTEDMVTATFPHIHPQLPREIKFLYAEDLISMYPGLPAREREREACRQYGAVFIQGIGAKLSDGERHDGRAPDYDDWSTVDENGYEGLNGDILVWNSVLEVPFELSSMGIRVSPESLRRQLEIAGATDRCTLPFHKRLLEGGYPYTIGGGIGQSRLCMLLLQKAHIGEVQSSLWPQEQLEACQTVGIVML